VSAGATTAADLLAVVRLLVDDPKEARVEAVAQGPDQLLEIRVPSAERGKIIGRRGRTIEALQIEVGGTVIRSSVSIGVASREPGMADTDALVNAADRALYGAKESGRNRSCITIQGKLRCLP